MKGTLWAATVFAGDVQARDGQAKLKTAFDMEGLFSGQGKPAFSTMLFFFACHFSSDAPFCVSRGKSVPFAPLTVQSLQKGVGN